MTVWHESELEKEIEGKGDSSRREKIEAGRRRI